MSDTGIEHNPIEWDPASPHSWSRFLGMANVPMFGSSSPHQDSAAIIADGRSASFAFFVPSDDSFRDEPLSWAWSSNVNSVAVVDTPSETLLLRRWDTPDTLRKFKLPKSASGGMELARIIESSSMPRTPDVVSHLLRGFQQIRSTLHDPTQSILAFNAFLLGAKAVRKGVVQESEWRRMRTVADVVSVAQQVDREFHLPTSERIARLPVGMLPSFFSSREPFSNCLLDTDLLLRHTASTLFQEAHLSFERDGDTQLSFPGMTIRHHSGVPTLKDARYTPVSLARSLVEQALVGLCQTPGRTTLTILDPSCGSGGFLHEALLLLDRLKFAGSVKLLGIDTSSIACSITEFCLRQAKSELSPRMDITFEILNADALVVDWHSPDVILMNPPFAAWSGMDNAHREIVSRILGSSKYGRSDKALAFLKRAVDSVSPGGTVATVLPSTLLESQSSSGLRDDILKSSNLQLVGKFTGLGYFKNSTVETAFVVLRAREPGPEKTPPTKIVYASEGYEDAALRSLRALSNGITPPTSDKFDVYSSADFPPAGLSWSPRTQIATNAIARLHAARLVTVGRLFEVKQGIRSGLNAAFVLSHEEYGRLTNEERSFFRAVAGNDTIESGRVLTKEFIFYPYSSSGPMIREESDLPRLLPTYYESHLRKYEESLRGRVRHNNWWDLDRSRRWIVELGDSPKIVSSYFGDRGSFAYDHEGKFVVVQGFAWIWKKGAVTIGKATKRPFHRTNLPWAYAALMNSKAFESVLAWFCPRLSGGQLDLSARFSKNALLPDLTDSSCAEPDIVFDLSRFGKGIADGTVNWAKLDDISRRIMRLSTGETL